MRDGHVRIHKRFLYEIGGELGFSVVELVRVMGWQKNYSLSQMILSL